MILKKRVESEELVIHNYLCNRINFSLTDTQRHQRLKDGYHGELLFDSFTSKITCEHVIIQDLLLSWNNTLFQIDTLLVLPSLLYVYEVKNFKEDYIYGDKHLIKLPHFEVQNPLHQVQKSETLLQHLVKSMGHRPVVNSKVVFVNPSFFMYQTPQSLPFLFNSQLKKHIQSISSSTSSLTPKDNQLVNSIMDTHIPKYPNPTIPKYSFESINKGARCIKCGSIDTLFNGKSVVCTSCGGKMNLEKTILKNAEEFTILFPNIDLTTVNLQRFCRIFTCKRTIRNVLAKYFDQLDNTNPIKFYKRDLF
ncbi:nuclease-related domain-containing protein [Mangrovibacillus cuniculi]|uniref:NERD domain-containing protein n=1 Tax=Mangrovibacillus cuniculi TaxID=2593652 RepID=A0A7S8CDL7_9BACI|nr:nuclease-related domain-containing protein [Mangrovibacillus cuniculi]QPC47848.1 NERD domain-containing protein [Mangrovibacillus cuniculi]